MIYNGIIMADLLRHETPSWIYLPMQIHSPPSIFVGKQSLPFYVGMEGHLIGSFWKGKPRHTHFSI